VAVVGGDQPQPPPSLADEAASLAGQFAKMRALPGCVQVLTIGGDKASVDVSGDLKIRRLLGGLKSTLFDVKREGNTFVFNGAGFGHGVGMCQLGAIGMAEAGKTNAQILEHYYRGTHLHRLY
ncbi:MAG TPA: hypothetical protein VL326_37490, partial [Kofleriaceae bacterium]|nr:hypothetical protein [Kofleriaceae bacterium]